MGSDMIKGRLTNWQRASNMAFPANVQEKKQKKRETLLKGRGKNKKTNKAKQMAQRIQSQTKTKT